MSTKRKDNLAKNKVKVSTQQYLDIAEIKEDTVIMRDGTLRAVLLISSINFALKSEDEQDAIVASYVSFLNNLNFPIQIVVQSRELNIDGYIESLKKLEKEQTNELLKMQTAEYMQYIIELISMSKIMTKRFFVIIPYNPLSDKQKKFTERLAETFKPASLIKMKDEVFQRRKVYIDKRIDNIVSGLNSMGLSVAQLDTQGLIELYYNSYNPVTSANEPMTSVEDLRVNEK